MCRALHSRGQNLCGWISLKVAGHSFLLILFRPFFSLFMMCLHRQCNQKYNRRYTIHLIFSLYKSLFRNTKQTDAILLEWWPGDIICKKRHQSNSISKSIICVSYYHSLSFTKLYCIAAFRTHMHFLANATAVNTIATTFTVKATSRTENVWRSRKTHALLATENAPVSLLLVYVTWRRKEKIARHEP